MSLSPQAQSSTASSVVALEPAPLSAPPETQERRRPLKVPRTALVRVLWLYAASRGLVLAAAGFAALRLRDPGAGPWPQLPAPEVSILRALGRWDSAWYLDIARRGYGHTSAPPGRGAGYAFFPMYPWVVRVVSAVTLTPPMITALILSLVLGGAATVLCWVIVRDACGGAAADRAAAFFCFFPSAFVLSMAYAESLMIAAVAASLLALMRRRWVTAGVLGAVATATRPNAVVILAAAMSCAIPAWRRGEGRRPFLAPALSAGGFVVVVVYQWLLTGHLFEWLRVEGAVWHDRFGFTPDALRRLGQFVTAGPVGLHEGQLNDFVWAGGLLLGLIGACVLIRSALPTVLKVYGIGAFAFACVSYNVGPRPRLLLAAFPIVLAVGVAVRGKFFRVTLVASAIGLAALSVVTFTTIAAVP